MLTQYKKLSNEIIMGRTTEDTAMELDGEGVQILNNCKTSSEKNAINAIANMHGWKTNVTSWNIK